MLLAVTSHSLLLNLPIAMALIVLAIWLATHFQIEPATPQKKKRRGNGLEGQEGQQGRTPPTPFASILDSLAGAASKSGKSWRDQVGSPVVESAWETLCGSILQEVRHIDSMRQNSVSFASHSKIWGKHEADNDALVTSR